MSFEVFKRQRPPKTRDPHVTIQRRGTISINRPAFNALGEPDSVELLYDRTERLVGIRPVNPNAPHAYPVRPNGRTASSFLIAGNSFTQWYDIPTDIARRWPAHLADGMLVVDLKTTGVEVISNRNKAKRKSEQA